jgi:outer membrane protein OmpA-like peptidoglycan-associated protein
VVSALDGVRIVHVVVGPPDGSVAGATPTPSLTLVVTPSATPPSATPSTPASPSPGPTTPAPSPSASGTPGPVTAAQVQAELDALPKIHFPNNQATLGTAAKQVLGRVATIMKANPGVRLVIEGNADSVGTAQSNLVLSRARAKAVYDVLVGLGVPASQLSTVGYGETRPLVHNDTAGHRAQNRRIDYKAE